MKKKKEKMWYLPSMAWAMRKPVYLIKCYQQDEKSKSYVKVIENWESGYKKESPGSV